MDTTAPPLPGSFAPPPVVADDPVAGPRAWQQPRPLTRPERTAWWSLLVAYVLLDGVHLLQIWVLFDIPVTWALLDVVFMLVQAAFIITGFVLWARRPNSTVGPLLVLHAFVIAVHAVLFYVSYAAHPVSGAAAVLLSPTGILMGSLIAHAMMVFPDGRITTAAMRRLLAIWYVGLPVLFLSATTLGDLTYANQCFDECPRNPIKLVNSSDAFLTSLEVVLAVVSMTAWWGVLLVVVPKYRRMGAADRRRTLPVLLAFGILGLCQTSMLLWTSLWDAGVTFLQVRSVYDTGWFVAGSATLLAPIAMAVGMLSTRLARAEVASLVTTLRTAAPDDVRPVLAKVLHDPRILIAVPTANGDGLIDLAGRPIAAGDGDLVRTELGGGAFMLSRSATRRADPVIFDAAVEAVRLSLDNARLTAEVRAQLTEVSESRARVVTAADDARTRLEHDLHDGAQQQLLGLGMTLVAARRAVDDDSSAARHLDEATQQLRDSLVELRQLSRGLRPALLAERGLGTALDDLRRRLPVPVTARVEVSARPTAAVETAAYYVIAETLQNVTRHAPQARADVQVDAAADGTVVVVVRDNGPGGADPLRGTGLRGLADRVAAVGGQLELMSPVGVGTTLTATFPPAAPTGGASAPS